MRMEICSVHWDNSLAQDVHLAGCIWRDVPYPSPEPALVASSTYIRRRSAALSDGGVEIGRCGETDSTRQQIAELPAPTHPPHRSQPPEVARSRSSTTRALLEAELPAACDTTLDVRLRKLSTTARYGRFHSRGCRQSPRRFEAILMQYSGDYGHPRSSRTQPRAFWWSDSYVDGLVQVPGLVMFLHR